MVFLNILAMHKITFKSSFYGEKEKKTCPICYNIHGKPYSWHIPGKNYLDFSEFVLIARNFWFCICIFTTIIIKINRFDYNKTVHSMHLSSRYFIQVIYHKWFLPPFFYFHVIYRLPFSISMLFTGSLFQFPGYLQPPFFNFHVIDRFPFSISMLFTGSPFQFPGYL